VVRSDVWDWNHEGCRSKGRTWKRTIKEALKKVKESGYE
jgi:hypothetical protein